MITRLRVAGVIICLVTGAGSSIAFLLGGANGWYWNFAVGLVLALIFLVASSSLAFEMLQRRRAKRRRAQSPRRG